jgi:hypothetical protein
LLAPVRSQAQRAGGLQAIVAGALQAMRPRRRDADGTEAVPPKAIVLVIILLIVIAASARELAAYARRARRTKDGTEAVPHTRYRDR